MSEIKPTHRQHERRTDVEHEAMAEYLEELQEARRQDAEAIRERLAAQWTNESTGNTKPRR